MGFNRIYMGFTSSSFNLLKTSFWAACDWPTGRPKASSVGWSTYTTCTSPNQSSRSVDRLKDSKSLLGRGRPTELVLGSGRPTTPTVRFLTVNQSTDRSFMAQRLVFDSLYKRGLLASFYVRFLEKFWSLFFLSFTEFLYKF